MSGTSCRRERGAGSAEYIGTIVVAAMLVGAVALAISPQGANVRAAVCDSVGSIMQTQASCGSSGEGAGGDVGDGGGKGHGNAAEEDPFKPAVCEVSHTGMSGGAAASIAFIDFGESAGLVRREMSDGSIILTAADGDMLGASASAGVKGKGASDQKVGASLDFGGGLTLNSGDTWTFTGPNAAEEAAAFESLLNDHRARAMTREQNSARGPGGTLSSDIIDLVAPLDPLPMPTSSTTDIGMTAEVSAQLGITVQGKKKGTSSKAKTSGTSPNKNGGVASFSPDANWQKTTNHAGTESAEDDTTTYTVDLSMSGAAAKKVFATEIGSGGTTGMSMSITENAEGQIVGVTIVSTNEQALVDDGNAVDQEVGNGAEGPEAKSGSGSFFTSTERSRSTVKTTELTLDPNDPGYTEDVAVVEGWLGGDGYEWPGVVPMSAVNPALPGDDPFSQLMHEQATVTEITSEGETNTVGAGGEVAVGVKVGLGFQASSSDAHTVDAKYLAAPEGGERSMVPYDCI